MKFITKLSIESSSEDVCRPLALWQCSKEKNGDIENRRNNTSVIDKARFKVWVIVPARFIRSKHLEMVAPFFSMHFSK